MHKLPFCTKERFMRTIYSTLLLSFLMLLSPAVFADSPTKAELYDGIEITVNINTATAEELSALLVGVGDKKAQEIVDPMYSALILAARLNDSTKATTRG
eukprot:TRINITY_DN16370_c0_g1_i1.p1 TRINITY_DN16370_c0_g1~~TRINITY_DN16370_c0_g1_i1.p1  ORF type:complete len:100 (-),score=35.64 TRINITY_DN16370_c0_g1_i1:4-303(-)